MTQIMTKVFLSPPFAPQDELSADFRNGLLQSEYQIPVFPWLVQATKKQKICKEQLKKTVELLTDDV